MPVSGSGHIVIHMPEILLFYINGVDYSDHITNYEFVEQKNNLTSFTASLVDIGTTEKTDVARGNDIMLRYGSVLVYKCRIEKCDYKTYDFCDISGYDTTQSILKARTVNSNAGESGCDTGSEEGRPIYSGTTSGVASNVIVAGQLSGTSIDQLVRVGTNTYLGHIVARADFDNILAFEDGMIRNLSGVWWSSYGASGVHTAPYATNHFNVSTQRVNPSVAYSFYLSGDNANAIETSRQIDEESLATSVSFLGYGSGQNQLQARAFHATSRFSRLSEPVLESGGTQFALRHTYNMEDGSGTTVTDSTGTSNGLWEGNTRWESTIKYEGSYSIGDFDTINSSVRFSYLAINFSSGKGTFYLYLNTLPSGGFYYTVISWQHITPNYGGVQINSDGTITLTIDGTSGSTTFALTTATWYKVEFNWNGATANILVDDVNKKTFTCSKTLTNLVSTSTAMRIGKTLNPIGPSDQLDGYVDLFKTYEDIGIQVDNIDAFANSGTVWVGLEKITYSGKRGSNLVGIVRSSTEGTDSNGYKFLKSYNHSKGVAVFDTAYTEISTDGNSKIDSLGLHKQTFTDQKVLDQDALDLAATNALIDNWYLKERVKIVPVDLYDCLQSIVVGSIVYVQDTEAGLDGNVEVVGQTLRFNEGSEELGYEVSNYRDTLTHDLQTSQQKTKVGSQYMQAVSNTFNLSAYENCDDTTPLHLRFYLPPEIIKINSALLNFKVKNYRNYGGNSSSSSTTGWLWALDETDTTNWQEISPGDEIVDNTNTNFNFGIATVTFYAAKGVQNAGTDPQLDVYVRVKDDNGPTYFPSINGFRLYHAFASTHKHNIVGVGDTDLKQAIYGSSAATVSIPFSRTTSGNHTVTVEAKLGDGTNTVVDAHFSAFLFGSQGLAEDLGGSDATINVDIGLDGGTMNRAKTNSTGETALETKEWFTSGISLISGNWIDVRFTPNKSTRIEANLFAKVFIHS